MGCKIIDVMDSVARAPARSTVRRLEARPCIAMVKRTDTSLPLKFSRALKAVASSCPTLGHRRGLRTPAPPAVCPPATRRRRDLSNLPRGDSPGWPPGREPAGLFPRHDQEVLARRHDRRVGAGREVELPPVVPRLGIGAGKAVDGTNVARGQTLEAHRFHDPETMLPKQARELLRSEEVGWGEPAVAVVVAGPEDPPVMFGVGPQAVRVPNQRVDQLSVAGDHRNADRSPSASDPYELPDGAVTVARSEHMVQGTPKAEHPVERRILELGQVGDRSLEDALYSGSDSCPLEVPLRPLDVHRAQVHQRHPVASAGELDGISPRPSTDVEQIPPSGEVLLQEVERRRELQSVVRIADETVPLVVGAIVLLNEPGRSGHVRGES